MISKHDCYLVKDILIFGENIYVKTKNFLSDEIKIFIHKISDEDIDEDIRNAIDFGEEFDMSSFKVLLNFLEVE